MVNNNFKKTDYFFSKEKYENLLQEKDTYLYVLTLHTTEVVGFLND